MARPLRFQEHPWQPVELTMRCRQSRFLLRPGEEANARVLGVIGRALHVFAGRARIYFGGATSNHIHLLAAFESAEARGQFKAHVKANISKEIGRLHDWPGGIWQGRGHDIPVLDDEAFIDRLMYLAAHGVKEGLAFCPHSWPGIQWVRAVTEGKPLTGVWYDRTMLCGLTRAWSVLPLADRGRRPSLGDVAERLPVELTPPPMWAHLSPSEQRTRWQALVGDALERYPAAAHPQGADAVRRADPHTRPAQTKKSRAPRVHTRQAALRQAWFAAYGAFVDAYRAAMNALRAGEAGVCFPTEGCRPVCFWASG
ncbi:MAG: hypothetical protein R3F65_30180 [bacterium]